MTLALVAAPAAHPITLAEAKAFLRVDNDAEDALIDRLIGAATGAVENYLGRALVTQQWALRLPCFPGKVIELPLPPVQSVDSIVYVDAAGATQTLDPSAYVVCGLNADGKAEIYGAPDRFWPALADRPEAVTVTFTAGYPATDDSPQDPAGNIPDVIKLAILETVATRFNFREGVTTTITAPLPDSATAALVNYKIWSFG